MNQFRKQEAKTPKSEYLGGWLGLVDLVLRRMAQYQDSGKAEARNMSNCGTVTNHLRLFIADDSPLVLERVKKVLGTADSIQVVGEARNVPDALHGIRQELPDVVILDIHMPGGSGLDVLREIKTLKPSPIVIMLTSFGEPSYQKKCLQLGAEFFLEKGTQFDELGEVIDRILKQESSE